MRKSAYTNQNAYGTLHGEGQGLRPPSGAGTQMPNRNPAPTGGNGFRPPAGMGTQMPNRNPAPTGGNGIMPGRQCCSTNNAMKRASMTPYQRGFIGKCAELGVDPVLVLGEKAAKCRCSASCGKKKSKCKPAECRCSASCGKKKSKCKPAECKDGVCERSTPPLDRPAIEQVFDGNEKTAGSILRKLAQAYAQDELAAAHNRQMDANAERARREEEAQRGDLAAAQSSVGDLYGNDGYVRNAGSYANDLKTYNEHPELQSYGNQQRLSGRRAALMRQRNAVLNAPAAQRAADNAILNGNPYDSRFTGAAIRQASNPIVNTDPNAPTAKYRDSTGHVVVGNGMSGRAYERSSSGIADRMKKLIERNGGVLDRNLMATDEYKAISHDIHQLSPDMRRKFNDSFVNWAERSGALTGAQIAKYRSKYGNGGLQPAPSSPPSVPQPAAYASAGFPAQNQQGQPANRVPQKGAAVPPRTKVVDTTTPFRQYDTTGPRPANTHITGTSPMSDLNSNFASPTPPGSFGR